MYTAASTAKTSVVINLVSPSLWLANCILCTSLIAGRILYVRHLTFTPNQYVELHTPGISIPLCCQLANLQRSRVAISELSFFWVNRGPFIPLHRSKFWFHRPSITHSLLEQIASLVLQKMNHPGLHVILDLDIPLFVSAKAMHILGPCSPDPGYPPHNHYRASPTPARAVDSVYHISFVDVNPDADYLEGR
jgi:hypothetical protein